MARYLFCISFNGFFYSGWQIQKNAITVQQVVEQAIKKVVGFRVFVVSCSRTDAGVHANNFYFHSDFELNFSLKKFKYAVNNCLPFDVVLKDVKMVEKTFHARYSAKKKEYIYKVWVNSLKNPFLKGLVMNYSKKINLEKMLKAAKFFVGEKDFSSFCKEKTKVLNKVRTIYSLEIFLKENFLIFKLVGNGFLHNMVRIIVGTLLDVSEGLISPNEIEDILKKKNRKFAGRTAKAQGLYLNNVFY